ncbi:MAG: flippase [Dehalococcoidia bacterium]|nr:flippase [Dehalococcoidia bacterium]
MKASLRASARSGWVQRVGQRLPGHAPMARLIARLPGAESLGRRVAVNSGWLIAERILHMGVALAISVQVIRYLGPQQYGVLAYGLSIVAMVDVVSTLGMRSTVVRELLEYPERRAEVLGSTVGLRLVTSLVALAVLAVLWAADPGSRSATVLVVLAAGLPLMSLAQLDLFFQASLQSQYAVGARFAALVVGSALRVAMLVAGAPLLAFAVAGAVEFTVTGIAFGMLYQRREGSLRALRFTRRMSVRLMAMSWPLFLSALASVVYLRIDQVMLQHLVGPREVGIYAAAARLSEIWYFLPIAIASSMLPLLVMRRLERPAAYTRSLEQAFGVSAWLAILLALGTTVIATPLVAIVFGADFSGTAGILRVHMWATPFIFVGAILGRALIAEDRRTWELTRHVTGAGVNVVLNLALIPAFGGMGAAVATLISYAVAGYLLCFAYAPTRVHGRLITSAVLRPWRLLRAG